MLSGRLDSSNQKFYVCPGAVVLACQLYGVSDNGLERAMFVDVTAVESAACAVGSLFSDSDVDGWLSCTSSINTGGLRSTL